MNERTSEKFIEISSDRDVVRAREAGTILAAFAGFKEIDRVRFATAISELTHNVIAYAGKGRCRLSWRATDLTQRLEAEVSDDGPGIADINCAMTHGYSTGRSLGVGLPGTQRIVDEFNITSSTHGTTVKIAMLRPITSDVGKRQ